MKSYRNLVSEIKRLQGIADKRRSKELGAAIASIRRTMTEYAITLEELEKALRKRAAASTTTKRKAATAKGKKRGRKVAPKYRDRATGATWSGRGLAPKWLTEKEKAGAKREDFLIAKPAAKGKGRKPGSE